MNRFASIATTAALAGSLIGSVSAAQAMSLMYLAPVSDITATYAPGAIVKFNAFVDLGTSSFASFSIPFATAFTSADISYGTGKKASVSQANVDDPQNSGTPIFPSVATSFTTTASKVGGNTVYTFQDTVGHVLNTDTSTGSTVTLAAPAGTYAIGTFSFQIALSNTTSGSATIYLPTPFGFSDSANATDGAYVSSVGGGPLNYLLGKDIKANNSTDPIAFPGFTGGGANGANGKYSSLKFKVTTNSSVPAPSSLLVIAMGVLPAVGLLRRRSAK